MPELLMPRLTEQMAEGTIARWLVSAGDHIKAGQEVAEVDTDKATTVIESPFDGLVGELVPEGETVAVGAPIALVGDRPAGTADAALRTSRHTATPVARRMARELNVDLAAIRGSGPEGRIVKADVVQAAAGGPVLTRDDENHAPPVETARGSTSSVALTKVQAIVARRMAESRATVPDFDAEVVVNMDAAAALREGLRQAGGNGRPPSLNDMVVRACALALREHRSLNSSFRDEAIEVHDRINIGIAVATDVALVVPVIADADTKPLSVIGQESRALSEKARDGKLAASDLSGGTFTVSNLGMFGVDAFTAVVNPPQAAILAVGAVSEQPVVDDGRIEIAKLMRIRLACDHRVVYGAGAAQFLSVVRAHLESPMSLVM